MIMPRSTSCPHFFSFSKFSLIPRQVLKKIVTAATYLAGATLSMQQISESQRLPQSSASVDDMRANIRAFIQSTLPSITITSPHP
jgi:hypothetical protein